MTTTTRRARGTDKQEALIARLMVERTVDYAVADNARTARELIDHLFKCPARPDAPRRPLSAAQDGMVRRVAAELGRDADAVVESITRAADRSRAIDALLSEARAARAERNRADDIIRAAAAELPVNHGYVLADGTFARTYRGQAGDVRVKILTDDDSWQYLARGLSVIARPDTRPITLDEAREIARRSHTCGHCGRGIETAESLERGLGPICAAKF